MIPAASPPRPLPIRPRPMTGESPSSYLRRLARANHLRPGYLRRYLRQPGTPGTIRLDWLAILAGRPLPVLERALADPASGHAPARQPARSQVEKPGLFALIRRDARDKGLSIRALADRHGVHRRTIRQALASPWPAPRKRPQRHSRLDPFKDTIDAMLLSGPGTPEMPGRTVKQIFDYLATEHEMTGISYATVRDYVAGRRLPQQPGPPHHDSGSHEAQLVITHLKGLLKAMDPGTADQAQPHLDALEQVIKQARASPGEEPSRRAVHPQERSG